MAESEIVAKKITHCHCHGQHCPLPEIDSSDEDGSEQYQATPKKFFAQSLAESLFNGLLQKIRHKGIPRQKGFLHLKKVTGYGSAASTKTLPNDAGPPKLPQINLLRSTAKLTGQAIQEACEKERQKKLRTYHQDGIPRYRPFRDFLDEFKHLVREAERQDQVDVMKKQANMENHWANLMDEIRNKGLIKSINRQVEEQRMDTVYNIWTSLRNTANRDENAAMAATHENRCAVQNELKEVVKKMHDKAKLEDDALTNYYADLKDQLVDSLRRKMLAIQSAKQLASDVKSRIEQDKELQDDPIRKQATTERKSLHEELKKLYGLVVKEERKNERDMISRQGKLKEIVLDEVVHAYQKKKTFADVTRNKLGRK